MKKTCFALLIVLIFSLMGETVSSQNTNIALPLPQTTGGMPLMEALAKRHSAREFSEKELDMQSLSNLLWAAFGINRENEGRRTAPSAMNMQEIDIYVFLPQAVYIYNAKENSLDFHIAGDFRKETGKQGFVKDAPINLVFVADYERMGNRDEDSRNWYAGVDAGYISQNVYLYCASENLNTVVRASLDKDALKSAIKLRPSQHIVFAQTVGYPIDK
ncbi:MAG: SagB/ThcOx family dehydrogenase [Bacteroidales bacterium]|nr:SagB/ThcOx family dehydrogenase [Bacteroidales bacterium]